MLPNGNKASLTFEPTFYNIPRPGDDEAKVVCFLEIYVL